jgi:hypothetical protein
MFSQVASLRFAAPAASWLTAIIPALAGSRHFVASASTWMRRSTAMLKP